jgi:hypothetical protein
LVVLPILCNCSSKFIGCTSNTYFYNLLLL